MIKIYLARPAADKRKRVEIFYAADAQHSFSNRRAIAPYHSRAGKLGRRGPSGYLSRVTTRRNMPVITVSLYWLPAGLTNGVLERSHALLLRGGCASHVENFFLQNCSVQIIHTVAERDLRKRQSKADPVSSQMIDVIEVNSAHRKIAQLFKRRGTLHIGQRAVGLVRFESKRNKTGESAGLIL